MKFPLLLRTCALALLVVGSSVCSAVAHEASEEIATAARNFLAALTPEQKQKATYEFKDAERVNWHFIPKGRNGLPLKEMTIAQRHLAQGLLASGLSQRGYLKATTIMSLEQVLFELENQAAHRDGELYYFTIFGEPSETKTWGWRVEGHHLSINFTLVKGHDIVATPSFYGSNPAEVKTGPRKGTRALAGEEDLGRKLIKSLTAEQRKTAITAEKAPNDVFTGNKRKVSALEPVGIPASKLTAEQNVILTELVKEYVYRHRAEIADKDLAKIKAAGWDKILFAWMGGIEPGEGHYYRVQGPTFLLEYDNVQNNNNHVHAVWRDFENDFGDDLLRRHHEEYPH